MADDAAVLDVDIGLSGVMLPGQGVLHPVLIVTLSRIFRTPYRQDAEHIKNAHLGVVLTGMRTTGLLARCSSSDSLNGTLEKVAEFKRLNEVSEGQDQRQSQ